MLPRIPAALLLALLTTASLLAQPAPLSLCLVQTKPTAAMQYDPSAGPWAVEMDKQLTAQQLRNGAPLHITVLAASVDKDVLPEVRRLQCPWVVQLWYQHHPDLKLSQAEVSANGQPPYNPQLEHPGSIGSEDSVLFLFGMASPERSSRAAPLPCASSSRSPRCLPIRTAPIPSPAAR